MPLYFLALLRLNAASRSRDPSRSSRVEAVEALHRDRRLREDLARDGDHDRPVARVLEVLGDGQVGHGPGPQHRAVGLLAPQVAEHVVGRLRVRQRVGEGEHPRGDAAAVELADPERGDVALQDAPGGHHVGADVDERGDDPVAADGRDQVIGGEPVLHGQHVAVRGEPVAQQFGRGAGVQALDRDDGVGDLIGELVGGDRVRGDGELVDRALDDQPAARGWRRRGRRRRRTG